MSYNMWGSAKADPPQQQESEDQNLTHEQRMAKYPKPMVAFDRDGVLFETDGTPIKREDAVPIVDAFKAIAMIRRKGYKIAMICDQPGLNANLITHEEVELGNAYVIELLGQYGCPSIDCILYNEGNEKHNMYAKPNTGMLKRMRDEFRVPYKGGYYIGDQVVDAKMAMKAGLSPILVRTGIQDHSKLNSFANKQLKRKTKIFDSLLDFADLL